MLCIVGQMTNITLSLQLESAFTKQKKSSVDPSLPAGCWHWPNVISFSKTLIFKLKPLHAVQSQSLDEASPASEPITSSSKREKGIYFFLY